MIATELKTDALFDLQPTDTVLSALELMYANGVHHLIIALDGKFQGMISEETLTSSGDDVLLQELQSGYLFKSCLPEEHVYELIAKMSPYKLSILPIVVQGDYLGSVTMHDIFYRLADLYGYSQPGSIFVLEMQRHEYALSNISRIIESEGGNVISASISPLKDENNIKLALKTNIAETGRIQATFERYGYTVMASYNDEGPYEIYKERYASLMNYLDV